MRIIPVILRIQKIFFPMFLRINHRYGATGSASLIMNWVLESTLHVFVQAYLLQDVMFGLMTTFVITRRTLGR